MSHAEEDLIDYSDEDIPTNENGATNGQAKKADAVTAAATSKAGGGYASTSQSSFRDFLLKPELLRAITDCGFEHPSKGQS